MRLVTFRRLPGVSRVVWAEVFGKSAKGRTKREAWHKLALMLTVDEAHSVAHPGEKFLSGKVR